MSAVTVGEPPDWDMDSRQGVHFFKQHGRVGPAPGETRAVNYDIEFLPDEGDFRFSFQAIFC